MEVGSTGSPEGSLVPGRTLSTRTRTSEEVRALIGSMGLGATMLIFSSPAPLTGPPSLVRPPPLPPTEPLLGGGESSGAEDWQAAQAMARRVTAARRCALEITAGPFFT